jgi:membrane-bound lytic murein transglycosylase D
MSIAKRILPIMLASLLAACATPSAVGPTHAPKPAPTPPTPPPAPAPAVTPIAPASTASQAPSSPAETADVWGKLRGSFAMADCDADPQIMIWAHRYTQDPQRFQAQMSSALSQVIYVQQVAEKYDVAGEFVLLPWVESQYRPVPGHRNLPAGMWQIVLSTAHVMGLHVDHNYDGRLDTSASTDSIMRMLHEYYGQLHDWRLVDYAFNHGEFGVHKLVQQYGEPPTEPAIPKMPVAHVTREHLTKLLAISCVIRDPSRFNVELPTLEPDQHLEAVQVNHGMTLSDTANHAGMATDVLKRLNPAVQSDVLSANVPQLLMPHRNAEQLRSTMQLANDQDMTASLSGSGADVHAPYADKSGTGQDDDAAPDLPPHHVRTHTVRPGESLWQIAKHYSVSVSTLERINNLHGKPLKPGQTLKLDTP